MVNSGEPVASVIYAYRGSDIPGAFIPAGMDWIYPPDIADTRRKWQNFTLLSPKSDKTDGMSIMEFTMSLPDVNLRDVTRLEVWIRAFVLESGLSVPPDDFRGLLKDMPVKLEKANEIACFTWNPGRCTPGRPGRYR